MRAIDDRAMVEHIHRLMDECHTLEKQHRGLGLDAEQRKRLADLRVEVDRQWEQLRQGRAARRAAGMQSLAGPLLPALAGRHHQPGP